MELIKIEELKEENFENFLHYLDNHLSENGNNNFFFLPLTKEQSKYSIDWEDKFKKGMNKKIGELGWRKIWIAKNEENIILGHIDIRSRIELNTQHRVLLGMGTDSKFRNSKVGLRLLSFVIDFCKSQSNICWIDLEVLTSNFPAISLYEKMKFHVVGSFNDMFRIQNQSYDYTSMTLNVESEM